MKHIMIDILTERRYILSKRFTDKSKKNPKTRNMFIKRTKNILVQLTANVSLSGLPVLPTLHKVTKKTNSTNCEFCVL